MQVIAPPEATHFSLYRLSTSANGSGRQAKLTGEAGENGVVPDAWPVAEFSTAAVLKAFGEGKYRVEWYTSEGDRIPPGQRFEVAMPPASAKRGAPRKLATERTRGELAEAEPLERAAAQANSGAGIGILELMALLRSEREEAREIAAQQAERDRQFWAQTQAQQAQLLQTVLARPAAAGAGDADLMRRELRLELEQRLFDFRRQMPNGGEENEENEDNDEPPANIDEAGERIAMRILGELESRAPEMVPGAIQWVLDFLKQKGIAPSPELTDRIRAAQNGHAHRS
jgi:hypothetical protein